MAAPAAALRVTYIFRDAKGQTGRMKVLVGGADNPTVLTDIGNLATDLQAVSNAHVSTSLDAAVSHIYGTNAEFPNVEDKAQLVFVGPNGDVHRFQIPAPILAIFNTDGETVKASQAAIATVISAFTSFVYGGDQDSSPLVYVGGIRQRRKFIRKFNIFTLDPTLGGEGE